MECNFAQMRALMILLAGLSIDARSREKMDITAKELAEEKELAYVCLKE